MTELAKEENFNKKLWLNSIKLFLKIALILIAIFFFIVALLFYFAPKADAKLFNFFGLSKAEEKCYEQIYKKSGKTSDLYNLIIFDMEHEYTNQELKNIEKIFKAGDYDAFCEKLNLSGVMSANGNKSLYPFVADTDAFFKTQQLRCTIKLGMSGKLNDWKNKVYELLFNNIKSNNLTDVSFESVMTMIASNKSLSIDEKQSFANQLAQKADNGTSFQDLLNVKLEKIKQAEGANDVQKILLKNAEVKLYAGQYYFELLLNHGEESELTLKIKNNHTTALNEYKAMVNSKN